LIGEAMAKALIDLMGRWAGDSHLFHGRFLLRPACLPFRAWAMPLAATWINRKGRKERKGRIGRIAKSKEVVFASFAVQGP
jgi:hypothetical protein